MLPGPAQDEAERIWRYLAASNWAAWNDVWTGTTRHERLDRLLSAPRFDAFLKEYSVRRASPKDQRAALRKRLATGVGKARSGADLDRLADSLFDDGLTHVRARSLVSKVAALAEPEIWIPKDRFGEKGLRAILRDGKARIPRGHAPNTLERYLHGARRVHSGGIDAAFAAMRGRFGPVPGFADPSQASFRNRVLDCWLMPLGGRVFPVRGACFLSGSGN